MPDPAESPTSNARSWCVVLGSATLLAAVGLGLWVFAPSRRSTVTIGVEGRRQMTLPVNHLAAVPYTHGDALAVRIASMEPTAEGFRYDIRYMAYGPGEHDLSRYLTSDPPTVELPAMIVAIDPLLADDYSGRLFDAPTPSMDFPASYFWIMTGLWGAWGFLLIPLVLSGRKTSTNETEAQPIPSVSERLENLLQNAGRGAMRPEQQADLERLLMAYWAEQLEIPQERTIDSLTRLRKHPMAGPQIRAVEEWLHSQSPSSQNVARELLRELRHRSEAPRGLAA